MERGGSRSRRPMGSTLRQEPRSDVEVETATTELSQCHSLTNSAPIVISGKYAEEGENLPPGRNRLAGMMSTTIKPS